MFAEVAHIGLAGALETVGVISTGDAGLGGLVDGLSLVQQTVERVARADLVPEEFARGTHCTVGSQWAGAPGTG